MLSLILLLASSGVVLASPRVKGLPLSQTGQTHSYQQHYAAQEQPQEAGASYKPPVHIVSESDVSDPSSVLVRISPQDLQHFQVQQGGAPLDNTQGTVDHQPQVQAIPDAQFTVPSIPAPNVQSNQGNRLPSRSSFQEDHQRRQQQKSRMVSPESRHYQNSETEKKIRGQDLLVKSSINKVLSNVPGNARLRSVFRSGSTLAPIEERLADNYTIVIPDPVDTFSCIERVYGYYADVDNDCHIFHVCMSMRHLFPDYFTAAEDIVFHYSFFCNEYTLFSQDSMTCVWADEALPCFLSPELYWMNENFFRKENDVYVEVNAPLPSL